jgi:environmental stress-induced protein Ves
MRIIRLEECRRMRWANGRGETIELAVAPDGATFRSLDWRLSAARVATHGPFSYLVDLDRTLVVTSGRGLTLTAGEDLAITLTPEDQPWEFPGELAIEATLIDGPVDDLNVMTRRGRFRHKMVVRRISSEIDVTNDSGVSILSLRDCDASYETTDEIGTLRRGDFVILDRGNARLLIRPHTETLFYQIRLWPV